MASTDGQNNACSGDYSPDRVVQSTDLGDYVIDYVLHDGQLSCACPGSEVGGLNIYFGFTDDSPAGTVYQLELQMPQLYELVSSNLFTSPPTLINGANASNPLDDYKIYQSSYTSNGLGTACFKSVVKYSPVVCDSLTGMITSDNKFDEIKISEVIQGVLTPLDAFKTHPFHQLVYTVEDATGANTANHSDVLADNSAMRVPYLVPNMTLNLDIGLVLQGSEPSNKLVTMYCDANSKIVNESFINLDFGQIRGCDDLWQGIEVDGATGGVILMDNESVVRGANRGINLIGQFGIGPLIANSSILDCQTGIRAARNGPGQFLRMDLDNATIAIDEGIPGVSSIAPVNLGTNAGIEVIAYDNLDLSQQFIQSATISDYSFGIRSVSANGTLENFDIRNCTVGIGTTGGEKDELLIANNTISRAQTGIDISTTGTRIDNNVISTVEEGIHADMRSTGFFDARDNTVDARLRGIYLEDLKEESDNSRITDNTITITGTTTEGQFGGVGIEHNNADGLVRGNTVTLKGNQTGIYCINGTDPFVQDNMIFLDDPAADATGIRVENTDNGYYHQNTVEGATTEGFTEGTGMYFSGSANSTLQCNVLTNIETGFHSVASNQSMQKQGTYHEQNRIATQLDIDGAGQGSVIGNQGQIGDHNGNRWPTDAFFIDAAHYSNSQTVTQQSRFFANKNDSEVWPSVIFTQNSNALWFEDDVPANQYDDCTNYPVPFGFNRKYEPTEFMLSGLGGSGLSQNTQTSWLLQTYDMVLHHSDPAERTEAEVAFLNTWGGTDLAALAEAHHLLKYQGADAATDVDAILSAVGSEDAVLSTMHDALAYWSSSLQELALSEADLADLEAIANLCVQDYGASVSIARGILSTDAPRYWDDATACQQTEPRAAMESEASGLDLAPNPTTDVIRLSNPAVDRVEVLSIDGQLQSMQSVANGVMSLGTLPPAIYLVRGYDVNGAMIGIEKVIKVQ